MKKKKKVRCGICGEELPVCDMVHDHGSDTGFLCVDCHMSVHQGYDEE